MSAGPKVVPKNTDMHPEYALNYLRGAMAAHMSSFTDDEKVADDMRWAVTGLLEYAIKLLDEHVYGTKA